MNRLLIAAILFVAAPVAAADAASSARDLARCQAMSASFGPKQKDVAKAKDARDEQAEIVEAKGEAWDDVEVLRHFSADDAARADEAKAEYEAAKADLNRKEAGLQALVANLNADITAFNKSCVTDN